MTDPEQLKILKKGVKDWNEWRKSNPGIKIDLKDTNLRGADLRSAVLVEADLRSANLGGANLGGANLRGAKLSRANLWGANLSSAYAAAYYLEKRGYTIIPDHVQAILLPAYLKGADLSQTNLRLVNFNSVNLAGVEFSEARCEDTNFGSNDLSEAINLDKVKHEGPSVIGIATFRLSKGKIPEVFLRGCGLSDWEIESARLYTPDLSNEEIINIQDRIFDLKGRQPLQVSSLFISYSHVDGAFVDILEPWLINRGIRFWRDVHHATAGRLEKIIDRAMRLNPTVLLVLSKDSIKSDWVEHEINDARKLEKELGRDVLCPVALDDEWKKPNSWSQVLMDQVKKYNILDFSQWQDEDKFKGMFGRLVDGLDLFYKK